MYAIRHCQRLTCTVHTIFPMYFPHAAPVGHSTSFQLLAKAASYLGWCQLGLMWSRPGSLGAMRLVLDLTNSDQLQAFSRMCSWVERCRGLGNASAEVIREVAVCGEPTELDPHLPLLEQVCEGLSSCMPRVDFSLTYCLVQVPLWSGDHRNNLIVVLYISSPLAVTWNELVSLSACTTGSVDVPLEA